MSALGLLVTAVYLLSAYPVYFKSNQSAQTMHSATAPREDISEVGKLAQYLVDNELYYGYASYWHAGVISVFTDEKSRVRQVLFSNGLPIPMRHISSDRWYRADAWEGETFLVLTDAESRAIDWDYLATYHGKPERTLSFGLYKIYVFPKNLARSVPGYDIGYSHPIQFPASKYSYTQVGSLKTNAESGKKSLVSEKGIMGAVHFGPYTWVAAGNYKVSFDVRSSYNEKGTMIIDVTGANQKVLAEKMLLLSGGLQDLFIKLDTPQALEFRVWTLGNEKVEFNSVTLAGLKTKRL